MNEKIVTIITGASRGIGKGIALRLAEERHYLALFGRNKKLLTETAAECRQLNVEVLEFTGDVSDINFVNGSVNKILNHFGQIDNLINNAGVAVLKKFVDTNLEEFKTQMEANMYGVFNFTKAVLDNMIERNSGNIINISSLAGKNPFVYGTTYSATKHALMGFTRSLLLEVRQYNIRVTAICPGSVNTDMISGTPIEPKDADRVLTPADIAETVFTILNLPVTALVSEIDIRPTNPK